MIGMGVMINTLAGVGRGEEVIKDCIGKEIASVSLGDDDALHFVFSDGVKVMVFDDGQSCCEARYMRTDDCLVDFVGSKFLGLEIKDAPDVEPDYPHEDVHEVQFLEIKTSKGCFTMSSHNEHNGYYGGFWICAAREGK